MRSRLAFVFVLLVSMFAQPQLASTTVSGQEPSIDAMGAGAALAPPAGPVKGATFRPSPPPKSATISPPLETFRPAPASKQRSAPGPAGSLPVVGQPACSVIGPIGKACELDVTGARIMVAGAQFGVPTKPLVIDVRVLNANGSAGKLIGTCSGDQACTAMISTGDLPRGVRLRCTLRSASATAALGCSPFSDDSPIDYTIRLMRENGTEQWIEAKAGAPQPIDAAGTGMPDGTVLLLAGPSAMTEPPAVPPAVPPAAPALDTDTLTARLQVSSASGAVVRYGLEVYYQADQLYHFGFDGRKAGAPTQFDATITASPQRVALNAVPTGPATELTLLGGVVDGTLQTRSWPASSIGAAVEIGPVPPAIDVAIEPSGYASVGLAGSPNVRATIDQFERTSSITGVRQRTIADLPKGAPATLEVRWSSAPVDGKKASTFKLTPAPAILEVGLRYSSNDVVRDDKGNETASLQTDAVGTITGIPAGETTIQMIGEGDSSKVVLTAPSAIGSIEFGFGDKTTAGFWPPPGAGDDYVFMKELSATQKKLAVRIGQLVSATVQSQPVAGSDAAVLGFSMTHTPATMHLYVESGATQFFGSLVPPAVTEAEIHTDGAKVLVKPTSSGDITAINLHARSSGDAFFGEVREIDLVLSNLGPDTTITVASLPKSLTFTFKATVPINSLDAQLRATATPHAVLPPDTDGILLHQDEADPATMPFTAQVHLSGLTGATVKKVPSTATGAKVDDFELSLELDHSPRPFSVDVIDGLKRIWGSFTLPQKLKMVVDTGSTTASVGPESSAEVSDISLYLRTAGAPFFGDVKQMDLVVSNIPVGASFGVTSGTGHLQLKYSGASQPIRSADVRLREADHGGSLPGGTDGVLLHDLDVFSAHFHLTDLLSMSANQNDCSDAAIKCQRISASIGRASQQNTTVDIQTLPNDQICTTSGNPPVETCGLMTTTPDSMVFTLNSAPKTLNIAMDSRARKVDFKFFGVRYITSSLLGITIAYGASDASGSASLTQTGASSRLSLGVASLPSGPFNENDRHGNAVFFCLYKSSGCTKPPRDVAEIRTSISLQFFASAPVTIDSLFSCSSQTECSKNEGIHGSSLTAQSLQFAYAEVEGTIYNDRYIYADTGSRDVTASGRFWMNSPPIDMSPSGLWAEGAQVQLGAAYAPVKSYGKIDCDRLNFSVGGIGIPAAALKGLTGLCA